MNNRQLLEEVRKDACSCDMVAGRTCRFCRSTLPKLRKALKIDQHRDQYHRTESPYKPKKLPRIRYEECGRKSRGAYEPRRLRRVIEKG